MSRQLHLMPSLNLVIVGQCAINALHISWEAYAYLSLICSLELSTLSLLW
jgi:hypothetical protein